MSEFAVAVAAIFVVSAFGVSGVFAMGGGGDLSPSQSPYAILAPITLAPPGLIDGRAAYTNGDFSLEASQTPMPSHRFDRRSGGQRRSLARPSRNHRLD